MRKLFLLFAILTIFICGYSNSASAVITVEDYMSHDFLDKQGYSTDLLKLLELKKAQTFGETIPSDMPTNKWKRGWRKFWAYIDPAEDYGDFGMHDIHCRSTLWDY